MRNKLWLKICSVVSVVSFLFILSPLKGVSETDNAAAGSEPVEYVVEDIQGSNVQVLEAGTILILNEMRSPIIIS